MLDRNLTPAQKEIINPNIKAPIRYSFKNNKEIHYVLNTETDIINCTFQWSLELGLEYKFQLSTFQELVLSGSTLLTGEEIEDILDLWGCSIDFTIDLFKAHLTIKVLKEYSLECIRFVLKHMALANFPKDKLSHSTISAKAELESKQRTPAYWSNRNLMESVYLKDHIYGSFTNPSHYDLIDENKLLVLRDLLKVETCNIFVFGKLDESYLLLLEDSVFSENSSNLTTQLEKKLIHIAIPKTSLVYKTHKLEHTNQVALKALQINPIEKIDQLTSINLANCILGGYFGSRLMKDIRESKGLTYGIGSSFNYFRGIGEATISCQMNSQNTEIAIEAIKAILLDLETALLTEEEFNRAKNYYIGQLYMSLDDPSTPLYYQKNQTLQPEFNFNYYQNRIDTIKKITVEEVRIIFEKFYNYKNFHWSLCGDLK